MSTVVVAEPSRDLLSAIAEAARNPEVDAAKMQALWHLKESIDAQQAKQAFVRAFIACRSEMQPIVKDAWNDQTKSKYARLETIDKAISPLLSRYGFAFTFSSPGSSDKEITMSGQLLHTGGHSEPYQLTGPIDIAGIKGTANKTPMHALGSSSQYLRRYLKVMAFDIPLANEDNDGNGDPETIGKDKINQLLDVLLACDEIYRNTTAEFLKFMGVAKVEDIPDRKFLDAMTAARAKLRHLQKGQG